MSSTPYQTSDSILKASDLVAVPTTASTSTTPFGYSQAQADAIVAQLNAIIALLQAANTSGAV
jgi:hypothetical protein